MAAPARHLRFPLFDALRALAAIAILLVHVAIFTRGFGESWYGQFVAHLDIGVPFFFLLSAFLLYRPFVAARVEGTPAPTLPTYAVRRIARVIPAYWLVLTVAAIVPGMVGAFSGNWWVYYGLLQNYPVFTPEAGCVADPFRCGIPPTWTLAIEVAFYAVLPLYALATAWLGRRWRGRSWLVPELCAVATISAVSIFIQNLPLTGDSDSRTWLFFSPLGRGWWFGIGLALAAVSVWVEHQEAQPRWVSWIRERPWSLVATGAALYAFACMVVLEPYPSLAAAVFGPAQYIFGYVAFGVIAALVAMPAVFGGGGAYRRLLAHPLLTWLGLISYGIFLWQFPVLIFLLDYTNAIELWPSMAFPVVVVLTFAGTVACAAISYYALERPLMRWVRSRSGRLRGPGDLSVDSPAWKGTPT